MRQPLYILSATQLGKKAALEKAFEHVVADP